MKKTIIFLMSLLFIFSSMKVYGNNADFATIDESVTPTAPLEEESKTLTDYNDADFTMIDESITSMAPLEEQYEILSDYNENLMKMRVATNQMSLIALAEEKIIVSLLHEDDNFEALLVSLPGIDENNIEFVDFKITWSSPATELPPDYNSSPETLRSGTYNMGSVIDMNGGYFTIGSPTDYTKRYFYTANHGLVSSGNYVWDRNTKVGVIDRYAFGSRNDVSRVNMSDFGNYINSHISVYKATTSQVGIAVTAYTGYSGTLNGSVLYTNANVSAPGLGLGYFNDMLVTDLNARPGDSGACLAIGNSSIGILAFGGEVNGRPVTMFTRMANVPF